MTIRINGDVIEFEGEPVARINEKTVSPSMLDKFKRCLDEGKRVDTALDTVLSMAREDATVGMVTIDELKSTVDQVKKSL